jgi:hypothetical protein
MSGDDGLKHPPRKHRAARSARAVRSVRIGAFDLFTTGASGFDLRDPYHFIATMSWPMFFLCLVVSWDKHGRTSADIRRVSTIESDVAVSRSTAAVSEEPPA